MTAKILSLSFQRTTNHRHAMKSSIYLCNISRTISSTSTSRQQAAQAQAQTSPPPPTPAPTPRQHPKPLTEAQRHFLDRALRVNHAGELAATLIYTAQTPLLVRSHPHLRPLMQHMYDQEAGHFRTFCSLLPARRVRPTALYPVWTVAATVLGWGTAMLGREAAMACTEAVETEIGEHYNGQVREMLEWVRRAEESGEGVGEEVRELVGTIKRIRDEELEHLDHAVEQDAKEARPYELLTNVIRSGCKAAIWASERI